jgi:hypothetical protein
MSGNAMLMLDKVSILSTIENAKAYEKSNEKFIFCVDLLELKGKNIREDYWVNTYVPILQGRFDILNNVFHTAISNAINNAKAKG